MPDGTIAHGWGYCDLPTQEATVKEMPRFCLGLCTNDILLNSNCGLSFMLTLLLDGHRVLRCTSWVCLRWPNCFTCVLLGFLEGAQGSCCGCRSLIAVTSGALCSCSSKKLSPIYTVADSEAPWVLTLHLQGAKHVISEVLAAFCKKAPVAP